jgi:hypothetical protein
VSCGLHDVLGFEALGRPAMLIHSSVFTGTAAEQSRLLGQARARRTVVPHPIQDRTDDELRALAAPAVDEILAGFGLSRG